MRRLSTYSILLITTALSFLVALDEAHAYPVDKVSQDRTKIKRLMWQEDVDAKKRRGYRYPGAQWSTDRIKLRMDGKGRDFELKQDTPRDERLQKGLEAIMKKNRWKQYYVALLDVTDPANPRYAAVNEMAQQTPGSVAKVLLGAATLNELKKQFPKVEDREEFMRTHQMVADDWTQPNHHEVPAITIKPDKKGVDPTAADYKPNYSIAIRSVKRGDSYSLWEWMDHTLSPSSNASASMLWREATLMRALGKEYPPKTVDAELWKKWNREELSVHAFGAVDEPLNEAGLGTDDFYIRLFFTRGANRYVKGGSSRANPFGLLRWMLKVEQGKMIDTWSSLELKRLLYLTRRRIRYSLAPELKDSAVIFKTGSLYKCMKEEGFKCGAYRGNVVNVLNAIAVIETPPPMIEPTAEAIAAAKKAKEPAPKATISTEPYTPTVYMVAVMSNELRRSAAEDHARLGSAIHKLIMDNPSP